MFRPFNSDVFFLRNVCENFVIDIDYSEINNNEINKIKNNLKRWISNNDFRSIAQWIMNTQKSISPTDIYEICLELFDVTNSCKLIKDFNSAIRLNMNSNHILLAKMMTLFSKKAELKRGKSIYINVEPEDIIIYEPIIGSEELKHYKILEVAYMCGIDDFKHLSLFKLTRNKYNVEELKEKYWYNWEYHASFSPIWSKRIHQCKGYPDYNKEKVIFLDEELMYEFYELYGLEPDEQLVEIQNKSIQPIEKKYSWKWFNEKYKKNGLFEVYEEELEEFDVDGLEY